MNLNRIFNKFILKTTVKIFYYINQIYPYPYLSIDGNIKKVLVVCTNAIGDVMLITPSVKAIKKAWPNAEIKAMVHKERAVVLKDNPFIDEIIPHKKDFIKAFFTISRLRKEEFDICFILIANDPDILPICYLSNVDRIVGYRHETHLDFLLTHPIQKYKDGIHAIEHRLKIVGDVGIPVEDKKMVFEITEKERIDAVKLLESYNTDINRSPLIVFNLGAGKPYKCWPVVKFRIAAERLASQYNAKIVLIGGKRDIKLARQFLNQPDNNNLDVINTVGRLNLKVSMAILERCSCFITNDTGIMHIAFSLDIPTVSLFCPSDPVTFGPYKLDPSRHRVIKRETTCIPCITKKCKDPFCLNQISVDDLLKETVPLIQSKDTEKE